MTVMNAAKYPKFQPNQALSDKHLNELADYLLSQDLLTRAKTIGVGVLCGLNVRRQGNVIIVTRGVAITSAGYLMHLPQDCVLDWVRPYTEPESADLFPALDDDLDLLELLPEDPDDDSGATPVNAAHWQNRAVVLALEISEIANDKCENDCVDRGNTVFLTPKILLVLKSDLRRLMWQHLGNAGTPSEIQLRAALQARYDIDDFRMSRPLLNTAHAESLLALSRPYHAVCEATRASMVDRLPRALNAFSTLLPRNFNSNAFVVGLGINIRDAIDQSLADGGLHMQSVFDWLRHMVWAYNEWIDAAFDACEVCCPDPAWFPYHVMLDCAAIQQTCPPPLYRHEFVPSPLHSGKASALNRAQTYLQRLLSMSVFVLPPAGTMRLSPGEGFGGLLGNMPVPWYLDYNQSAPVWHFDWHRKCRRLQRNGYAAREESLQLPYQQPLAHNIDDCEFLRLEGHIGLDKSSVVTYLDEARREANLPFEVVTLRLGSVAKEDLEKYCGYEDLRLHYRVTRVELLCALQSVGEYLAGLGKYDKSKPGGGLVYEHGARIYLQDVIDQVTDAEISVADFAQYKPFSASNKEMALSGLRLLARSAVRSKAGVVDRTVSRSAEAYAKEALIFEGEKAFESGGVAFDRTDRQAFNDLIYEVDGVGLRFPPIDDFKVDIFDVDDAEGLVQNLIGRLLELEDLLKADPFAFDTNAFESQYAQMLNKARALRDGLRFLTGRENYVRRGFEQDLMLMMGHLIENCIYARLQELMAAFEERRQREEDWQYLSQFMLQHTGLEHKSGVGKGGTLVLVYAEEEAEDGGFFKGPQNEAGGPVNASLLLENYEAWRNQRGEEEEEPGRRRSGGLNNGLEWLESSGNGKGWSLDPVTLNQFFESFEKTFVRPVNNREVIVADFCLPYLCCGGCEGTSYLVLAELMLNLEKLVFCKDDTNPYRFEILPPGGRVRGPGVEERADGFYFRPADAGVPLGEVIFVYERDVRSAILAVQVREALTANFVFNVLSVSDTEARVRFEATANDADWFRWDFGDGGHGEGEVEEHTYDLSAGNNFTARLIAGNPGCDMEVEKDIVIEEVIFEAPYRAYCKEDETGVELTTLPEGGEVLGGEAAVTQREDGTFVFVPALLDLNGEPERTIELVYRKDGDRLGQMSLLVVAVPEPAFIFETADVASGWLARFHNQSPTNWDRFTWIFGDGDSTEIEDLSSVPHLYGQAGNYQATLEASIALDQGRWCTGRISQPVVLAADDPLTIAIENDVRDYSSTDADSYLLTVTPDGGTVTGPPGSVSFDGRDWRFRPGAITPASPGATQAVQLAYSMDDREPALLPLSVVRPARPVIGSRRDWLPESKEWSYTFLNQTEGNAKTYLWNFGEGQPQKTVTKQNVTHDYKPGQYKVILTASIPLSGGRNSQASTSINLDLAEPVQATEKDVSETISTGSKLYLDRLPELESAVGQIDADLGGLYSIAVEYSSILKLRAAEAEADPKPLLNGDFDDELVQMGRFLLSQTQRALLAVEKFALENPRLINAAEYELARAIWPLRHVPVQLALCLENARENDLTEESGHLALLSQFGKEDARLNTTTIRKLGIIPVDVETYRLVSRGLDAADNRPVYAELLNNLLKSVQTR